MGTMMEKEVLVDMSWKGMKHLVNMKRFDIPILRTMRKDDLSLNLGALVDSCGHAKTDCSHQ